MDIEEVVQEIKTIKDNFDRFQTIQDNLSKSMEIQIENLEQMIEELNNNFS